MARGPRMRIAAAVVGLVAATAVLGLEVPPTPREYLTDYAQVIGRQQEASIDERLAGLEQRTGHQVIAVFFPTLGGESLEDFTIRCAERWKVGRKGLDDGIIFFAFVRDRRMRLEVGYGLEEKVPDALASRLLNDVVKPRFAAGDFGGGVLALAGALEGIFRGEAPPQSPRGTRSSPGFPGVLVIIFLFLLMRAMHSSRRGTWGGFGGWGGFSGGGFSGGGFSGGGGSFGGGGASGSW